MEAVGSGRQRGTARAARLAWHPAPHSGVVRKLAQPGAGCPAVRAADLLDGEHVRAQPADGLDDHPVVLAPCGRIILEQVKHVVGAEQHRIRRSPQQPHGDPTSAAWSGAAEH